MGMGCIMNKYQVTVYHFPLGWNLETNETEEGEHTFIVCAETPGKAWATVLDWIQRHINVWAEFTDRHSVTCLEKNIHASRGIVSGAISSHDLIAWQ